MGLVIGMDEAGYGPNLGPLVVTVTAWDVPGDPREFDFWQEMTPVVNQRLSADGSTLHVADSKQVYSTSRGLAHLERSVLCALALGGLEPSSFHDLCRLVGSSVDAASDGQTPPQFAGEPWFEAVELVLPHAIGRADCDGIGRRWRECCDSRDIRLRAVRSDVVLTQRFNRLVQATGSKGVALSQISLRLLRQVWDPEDSEPVLIVADKHGGRNRYDGLLAEVLDGQMIFQQQESRQCSRYRVGTADIRFQMRAESHFPVAVASMISKYIRELSMELFNRFWAGHCPDVKPTKGYPADAVRFRRDVDEVRLQLGIADDVFWRSR